MIGKTEGPTRRIWSIIGMVLGVAIAWTPAAARSPLTRTQEGLVEGRLEEGLSVYRGIPFALPPVGILRWRAPQPVKGWTGVLAADRFAPACMQSTSSSSPMTPGVSIYPADAPVSEDCLYLNVWTPVAPPGNRRRLPVMVWIYGGAFTGGATSLYPGDKIAKKGVVVVSIAYRVGAFGFLAHPALSAESGHGSGDYGLLDQISGLEWVQRNIAAFGGDPHRVTIFGESAGGISVSMLAASPRAKGLFQGVISESGGSFGSGLDAGQGGERVPTLPAAEARGVEFLGSLGVSSIAAARDLPADRIQRVGNPRGPSAVGFWPAADGYVVTGDAYDLYARGAYNDTPILVGTNADEGALFIQQATVAGYQRSVRAAYGAFADKILEAYPATTDLEALRASRDLRRDSDLAWHTWTWARLQSRTGKGGAYLYYFNHRPPYPATPEFATWGAAHAAELNYVFGRHEDFGQRWRPSDDAMSETLIAYWTNFARAGDPNGAGLPRWPRFDDAAPQVMRFDERPEPGGTPNLGKLKVLDDYFAWRRAEALLR